MSFDEMLRKAWNSKPVTRAEIIRIDRERIEESARFKIDTWNLVSRVSGSLITQGIKPGLLVSSTSIQDRSSYRKRTFLDKFRAVDPIDIGTAQHAWDMCEKFEREDGAWHSTNEYQLYLISNSVLALGNTAGYKSEWDNVIVASEKSAGILVCNKFYKPEMELANKYEHSIVQQGLANLVVRFNLEF